MGSVLQNARGGGTDLPEELRCELADFDKRSSGLSHYEIIGIGPDADAGSAAMAHIGCSTASLRVASLTADVAGDSEEAAAILRRALSASGPMPNSTLGTG